LENTSFPIRPKSVFIGENNSGKTSILELMEVAFSPTKTIHGINEDDISYDCTDSKEFEVIFKIKPLNSKVFTSEERGLFYPHIDINQNGEEQLLMKLRYSNDENYGEYRANFEFLKSDGIGDGIVKYGIRNRVPLFLVPALRSAAKDLVNKTGIWGKILKNIELDHGKIEEAKNLSLKAAEDIMGILMGEASLRSTTTTFENMLRDVLWGEANGGELKFSALPSNERELLQTLQILVKNPGDTNSLAILDQGNGTQSVAVIALMIAYSSAAGFLTPSIALEEPENHLHPHSIRSLVSHLWKLPQQVMITTHSPQVAEVVSPDEIVLLKRRGARSVVRYVPEGYFNESELNDLKRQIRKAGSELFFARCVLFTEGDTEKMALPIFASALGIKLDQLGASIVGVSGGGEFKPFIKLLQKSALDIPNIVLCDNDKVALDTAKAMNEIGIIDFVVDSQTIEAKRKDLERNGLYFFPNGDFETYMFNEGHTIEYEHAISKVFGKGKFESYVRSRINNDQHYVHKSKAEQLKDFIKNFGKKPGLAFEAVNEITSGGTEQKNIPAYFRDVLNRLNEVAKREVGDSNEFTRNGPQ
jgi:putative ATP-dependent endonuclease of OLD family